VRATLQLIARTRTDQAQAYLDHARVLWEQGLNSDYTLDRAACLQRSAAELYALARDFVEVNRDQVDAWRAVTVAALIFESCVSPDP